MNAWAFIRIAAFFRKWGGHLLEVIVFVDDIKCPKCPDSDKKIDDIAVIFLMKKKKKKKMKCLNYT